MEENSYCVYMHTLIQDGRKYIGLTKYGTQPEKRWGLNGRLYKRSPHFYRAIQKYGWDSFKHEIVFNGLSRNQACLKEQALIKLFDTANPTHGFNMTYGGESNVPSPEAIHNISVGHIGKCTGPMVIIAYEALYEQYINQNKTIEDCAKYFGCCSVTINRWLQRYNIVKENRANKAAINKAHTRFIITFADLNYHYNILDKSIPDCAKYFGCSISNIYKKLDEFNITRKVKKLKCSENELRYQYITLDKTKADCARHFNCSETWVSHQLQVWNISK